MHIRIYTTRTCGDCMIAKKYLSKIGVPFEEVDIGDDPEAAEYVMKVNGGKRSVPTLEYGSEAVSLSKFDRSRLDDFLNRHRLLARTA